MGDGSTTLANSSGPISLLELTTAGSLVQTISLSTNATNGLQLTIAGDNPPFTGSGSLGGRSDVQAPRSYVVISENGTFSAPQAVAVYGGNNLRSVVLSDSGAYFAGGTSGTIYREGTTNTTIQSAVTNTRVVNIVDHDLYSSTASGTNRGIYGGVGTPTTAGNATYLINTGVTSDPYDFAFSPDGTRAYVTNGNTVTSWVFSGRPGLSGPRRARLEPASPGWPCGLVTRRTKFSP